MGPLGSGSGSAVDLSARTDIRDQQDSPVYEKETPTLAVRRSFDVTGLDFRMLKGSCANSSNLSAILWRVGLSNAFMYFSALEEICTCRVKLVYAFQASRFTASEFLNRCVKDFVEGIWIQH